MIFLALILLAFLALALVSLDAWRESEQAIRRVREEFNSDPAPWWVPRD